AAAEIEAFDDVSLVEDDVAFLQFTSGSTSEPKGVMVTFGNLAHNARFISTMSEKSFEFRGGFPSSEGGAQQRRVRGFSWLPQYHDLGLIMCTLTPFVSGWRMGYMSPLDFVRRPLLWLRLLSAERAMFGCAPDFSLRLCVRKWNETTQDVRQTMIDSVDLSALNWIQNGAEPIRASSIRDFASTFETLGLNPAYCGTAYGLAEHVVGVCQHEANLGGRPLTELSDQDLECVGQIGRLSDGSQLKIVDPESELEVTSGEVGEIWLSSPSVAAGYWGRPGLTAEAFSARVKTVGGDADGSDSSAGPLFLRTGDLARVDSGGRIFISGRIKDLIIVRGRNLYPQDVEFAVQEASPIVRPGCVAAFSASELGGELEVVLEVRKSAEGDAGALYEELEAVRRAVISEGCYPSRLVAIKEKTIPKTTSGKIQRRKSRELLHQGSLAIITELTAPAGALEPCPSSSSPVPADLLPSESRSAAPSDESESESSMLSSSMSSWVSASVSTPPPASSTGGSAATAPSTDGSNGNGSSDEETVDMDAATGRSASALAAAAEQEEGEVGAAQIIADVDAAERDDPRRVQPQQQGRERQQQEGPEPHVIEDDDAVLSVSEAGGESSDGGRGRGSGSGSGSLLSRQKSERLSALTRLVVATASEVLGGLTISPDQALFDAGFDSITAEEFVGKLQERLADGGWVRGGLVGAEGVVSSTTVFDCPTARHIAEHVEGVIGKGGGDAEDVAASMKDRAPSRSAANSTESEPEESGHSLAVVGISCRFPGGCDSPEAFWDFLRKGVDATSGVPSDRWSTTPEDAAFNQGGGPDKAGAGDDTGKPQTRGAFLSEGEAWAFDDTFFGVPPAEARCMDPQQRMMLEVGYEALHRAGFTRETLRGSDTGIFVGACGTDWATLLAEGRGPPRGPYTSTGAASSMLANRLSFTLGTVGPSMTVDTACSSSLVALRQACLH
ncbi:unnamed protein product, partial [Scytosiphon promiscuus]